MVSCELAVWGSSITADTHCHQKQKERKIHDYIRSIHHSKTWFQVNSHNKPDDYKTETTTDPQELLITPKHLYSNLRPAIPTFLTVILTLPLMPLINRPKQPILPGLDLPNKSLKLNITKIVTNPHGYKLADRRYNNNSNKDSIG